MNKTYSEELKSKVFNSSFGQAAFKRYSERREYHEVLVLAASPIDGSRTIKSLLVLRGGLLPSSGRERPQQNSSCRLTHHSSGLPSAAAEFKR
jgi:hypothetical protein